MKLITPPFLLLAAVKNKERITIFSTTNVKPGRIYTCDLTMTYTNSDGVNRTSARTQSSKVTTLERKGSCFIIIIYFCVVTTVKSRTLDVSNKFVCPFTVRDIERVDCTIFMDVNCITLFVTTGVKMSRCMLCTNGKKGKKGYLNVRKNLLYYMQS